jgi:hypothetical protein
MLNTSSCPLIDARQGALHALTQAAAQAGSRISISINRSPAYETGANASRLMPGGSRQVAMISSPPYLWFSPPASAMASERSTIKRLSRFSANVCGDLHRPDSAREPASMSSPARMSDGIGWDLIRSGSFGSRTVQTRVSKPSAESSPPFVSRCSTSKLDFRTATILDSIAIRSPKRTARWKRARVSTSGKPAKSGLAGDRVLAGRWSRR